MKAKTKAPHVELLEKIATRLVWIAYVLFFGLVCVCGAISDVAKAIKP